jgi:hypothetical protein
MCVPVGCNGGGCTHLFWSDVAGRSNYARDAVRLISSMQEINFAHAGNNGVDHVMQEIMT